MVKMDSINQDQKEFFLDYLNQVGYFDMEELHPLYKQSSPDQIDDIKLKVVMLTGIGKNLVIGRGLCRSKTNIRSST